MDDMTTIHAKIIKIEHIKKLSPINEQQFFNIVLKVHQTVNTLIILNIHLHPQLISQQSHSI